MMSNAVFSHVVKGCRVMQRIHQTMRLLNRNQNSITIQGISSQCTKSLHTSSPSHDLMEFFDDKKNWGEEQIKVGRSWRKEDLRLKSNSDLHKLWYVLLKERNMLMTMEHECYEAYEVFPNPERLDKVKESMHNLEEVIIERNRAYHELETGESGMQPSENVINQLGLPMFHRKTEHLILKAINAKWKEKHIFKDNYEETKLFHAMLGEKNHRMARYRIKGQSRHVLGLMRRFPNLDLEAVKEKFPEVDVDKLKDKDEARGNWIP